MASQVDGILYIINPDVEYTSFSSNVAGAEQKFWDLLRLGPENGLEIVDAVRKTCADFQG